MQESFGSEENKACDRLDQQKEKLEHSKVIRVVTKVDMSVLETVTQ